MPTSARDGEPVPYEFYPRSAQEKAPSMRELPSEARLREYGEPL